MADLYTVLISAFILNCHRHHCISAHLLPKTSRTDFPVGLLTHQRIFLLKVKKNICCDNRDFISFLLVSVGQQGLKRSVALRSFPNNAPFILFRKKGKSSHRKHLAPWFPAAHSNRAISKLVSPAEASVLRCPHTLTSHIYTLKIRIPARILAE